MYIPIHPGTMYSMCNVTVKFHVIYIWRSTEDTPMSLPRWQQHEQVVTGRCTVL